MVFLTLFSEPSAVAKIKCMNLALPRQTTPIHRIIRITGRERVAACPRVALQLYTLFTIGFKIMEMDLLEIVMEECLEGDSIQSSSAEGEGIVILSFY